MAKQSGYQRKKHFEFNLLPAQSLAEIEILEERDNTLLYSFILIFSSIFIYFVLTLIQAFFISNPITNRNTAIAQLKNIQLSYNPLRATRGELTQKANLLKSTLEKDIGLDEFIAVSAQISGDEFSVVSYGRNSDGDFILTFQLNSAQDAVEIIRRAKSIDTVSNVYAQNISIKNTNYDFIIQFKIENS